MLLDEILCLERPVHLSLHINLLRPTLRVTGHVKLPVRVNTHQCEPASEDEYGGACACASEGRMQVGVHVIGHVRVTVGVTRPVTRGVKKKRRCVQLHAPERPRVKVPGDHTSVLASARVGQRWVSLTAIACDSLLA